MSIYKPQKRDRLDDVLSKAIEARGPKVVLMKLQDWMKEQGYPESASAVEIVIDTMSTEFFNKPKVG